MLNELKIPRNPAREAALDHESLYRLGLERIQALSKTLWTDYNVHDPGITTLEILSYALTDLAYRASMPVADLLAAPVDNQASMQGQFYSARQILPNRALTEKDFRKLMIDLKGVKNAWIQPAPLTLYADTDRQQLDDVDSGEAAVRPVSIKGRYRVLIDYMEGLNKTHRTQVLNAVTALLHANRNLCEDFVEIGAVKSQVFILCGEFELADDADSARVMARILYEVERFLAPAVSNYSLSEMLDKTRADGTPYRTDEIFNGPVLSCGFIPDDELEKGDLRSEIRLSDIINIIMDIDGVEAISELQINPPGQTGAPENKWRVGVDPERKIRLDAELSRLVIRKNGMPLSPDLARVDAMLDALREASRQKLEQDLVEDFDIPSGRFRELQRYEALQNHFPAVYGIGENGLAANADESRKAEALQFKAYLLFFEQLLANYFAQLAHVRELFSTDPELTRTYHYQLVESFRDFDKIYAPGFSVQDIIDQVEDDDTLLERRNRFLDHLIARFSEQFTAYANVMASAFGNNPRGLIRTKCDFLNHYPAISAARGIAYNYSLSEPDDIWNSSNVSGLELRLCRLLGLTNATRRNLGDVSYDLYAEIDKTPGDEFRFRIRDRVDGSILLSSSRHYLTEDDARAEMRIAILAGALPERYSRKLSSNGRYYFNVVDDTGEIVARRIEYFDSETAMEEAIQQVMDYLKAHYSEEGLYLIENLLLLPEQTDDPFLPICVSEQGDEAELDPYSYRIHIVLPAYGTRFSSMDFRRYAERLIRAETPAHILPRICWINKDDMARLERAYLEWLRLKCGRSHAQREQKLTRFIRALYAAKNVYPSERINDCDADEQKTRFVLGRKSLGSLE
jgi:uncharacterized protein